MQPSEAAKWVILGWLLLLLSTFAFFVSTHLISVESNWHYVVWIMAARILGFCSFVLGAVSIFNNYWVNGVLLFIGSVALPIISLFAYGKL